MIAKYVLGLGVLAVGLTASLATGPAGVDTPASDYVLIGDDGEPFTDAFNAAEGKIRVVAYVAPTCGGCLRGANRLQDDVLDLIRDDRVEVLVVWVPKNSARRRHVDRVTRLVTDDRATHYWDDHGYVVGALDERLGLTGRACAGADYGSSSSRRSEMLGRIAIVAGVILLVRASVAFGPGLLRRDVVRYEWDGAMGEGVLTDPIGIAYADGRLFVTDAAENAIVVFDASGALVAEWGDSTLDLRRPMHLSLGPDRVLRVAEYLSDRVALVDLKGVLVGRIGGTGGSGVGELDAPGGAAEAGGVLFVADFYNHRVQVFADDATLAIGTPGRVLNARLHYPTDVAADDSLVYVADAYNHRVQVFRTNGEYVRKWGGPLGLGGRGSLRGWFKVATGIEVSDGRVYTADFENDRIQIFTDRGKYLGQVGDSLHLPTDVATGPRGELYVVDFGHQRVVRFLPIR